MATRFVVRRRGRVSNCVLKPSPNSHADDNGFADCDANCDADAHRFRKPDANCLGNAVTERDPEPEHYALAVGNSVAEHDTGSEYHAHTQSLGHAHTQRRDASRHLHAGPR